MKGLDSYLEGRNDPNNPANQTDWREYFECMFWEELTDEELEKYSEFFQSWCEGLLGKLLTLDFYSERQRERIMKANAHNLRKQLKAIYTDRKPIIDHLNELGLKMDKEDIDLAMKIFFSEDLMKNIL